MVCQDFHRSTVFKDYTLLQQWYSIKTFFTVIHLKNTPAPFCNKRKNYSGKVKWENEISSEGGRCG